MVATGLNHAVQIAKTLDVQLRHIPPVVTVPVRFKKNGHVSESSRLAKEKESTPTCSISHLHAMATCQEARPHRPD